MYLEPILKDIISAEENLRVIEDHCINKNKYADLTDYEMSTWKYAAQHYRKLLITGIEALAEELKGVADA